MTIIPTFTILLIFFIQHSYTFHIWKCVLDPEHNAQHGHQPSPIFPPIFSDFFAILLLFFIQHSHTFHIWKCALDPENSAQHHHQQWAPLLSSLMHLDKKFPFWRLQIAVLAVNISAEAGEGEEITQNFFRIRTPDTPVTLEWKINMWHKRDIFRTREKIF